MFFILTNEGVVIAADQAFLEYSDTKSIYLLAEEFRAGNFLFFDKKGEYHFRGNTSAFTKTPIKTIFGDGSLYQIEVQDRISDTEQQSDTPHHATDHEPAASTPQDQYRDSDEIMNLNTPDKEEHAESEDDELINLADKTTPIDEHDDIPINLTEDITADEKPVADFDISSAPFTDYRSNARLIGITTRDYHTFLEQYANEAKEAEPSLRGMNLSSFRDSATSLKDAAQLLNLSQLINDLDEIQNATSDEKESLLDTFFSHIEHIYRDLNSDQFDYDTDLEDSFTDGPTYQENNKKAFEAEATKALYNTEEPKLAELPFDNIESIPFDFSVKTAADELGLPEALVDEFVADFVVLSRENIPAFQNAHQAGDIETIQKTAHLLKDAASNLMIDPLAETLKDLQHNEDIDMFEPLFRKFQGQLKMLMNLTDKSTIYKG